MRTFFRADWLLASARKLGSRFSAQTLFFAFALSAYAVFLASQASFVAGGADSAGYLSSARLFAAARFVQPVTELTELALPETYLRVFIPLGFVPGVARHTMAATYPPGVPLQMAAAGLLGGWERAPFFVSGASALLALVLLYMLCREWGLSRSSSFGAGVILALCPTFLFIAIQPMSDVNATCWCLLAMLCAFRSHRSVRNAAGAGAALGLAVLVRPSNLFFLLPLLVALPRRVKPMLLFAAGGAPLAIFLFSYNHAAYGKAFTTGYGSIAEDLLAFHNFPPRFTHYTYQTLLQLSPIVPCAGLAALGRETFPRHRRWVLVTWFGVFFSFYCFYESYAAWWYLRFLLPGLPALIIGATKLWDEIAEALKRREPQMLRAAATAVTMSVLLIQLYQVAAYGITSTASGQAREYIDTTQEAVRLFPRRAFILSMQASGSLRYYANDFHVVRWDWLDAARAGGLGERLKARGLPLYALLFPFELAPARELFSAADWRKVGDFNGITLWRIEL